MQQVLKKIELKSGPPGRRPNMAKACKSNGPKRIAELCAQPSFRWRCRTTISPRHPSARQCLKAWMPNSSLLTAKIRKS